MRKLKHALIAVAVTVAILGSLLTSMYTFTLADRLEQVRRTSYADTLYLRGRIRELERELTTTLLDRLDSLSVGGTGGTGSFGDAMNPVESETDTATEPVSEPETYTETVPETDTEPDTACGALTESEPTTDAITDTDTEPVTEAVTLPTHQSPETAPPAEEEIPTTPPPAENDTSGIPSESDDPVGALPQHFFVVAEHKGRIGVFDETGELLRTVNVFVLSLPQADRDALTVGIVAYSEGELTEIIEKYE